MGFQLNLDKNAALGAGSGGGIDTGVHTVTIVGAFLVETKNGNNTIDLELETKTGAKGTVYGMCIDETWKSGAKNYDYPRWQELAAVLNMATGATAPVKRKDFNGVESDAVAFTEITGQKVQVAIQVELDINDTNGKETRKRKLNRTFFATGHSLAEKQSGSEAKQSISLGKNLKDYATAAYKAAQANGGATTADATEPNEASAPDTSLI